MYDILIDELGEHFAVFVVVNYQMILPIAFRINLLSQCQPCDNPVPEKQPCRISMDELYELPLNMV